MPDLLCQVTKRYKYITLTFKERESGRQVKQFTIHQVEGKKLIGILQRAVSADLAESFDDHDFTFVEGVYEMPPPEKYQIAEFRNPLE